MVAVLLRLSVPVTTYVALLHISQSSLFSRFHNLWNSPQNLVAFGWLSCGKNPIIDHVARLR